MIAQYPLCIPVNFISLKRSALVSVLLSLSQFCQALPAQAGLIHLSKSSVSARFLALRSFKGNVTVQIAQQKPRAARLGDRLTATSDRVVTGAASEATLAIDEGAAIVRLTENTVVEILRLQKDAKGGNITLLSVPKGLARLQVRPFNRPTSRLDIFTPAGVAGVRGTQYGVGVNPNGKSTIATLIGSVAVSAQGQTQFVKSEQYSLIVPGKPPTPPQSLSNDLSLRVQKLNVVQNPDTALRQIEFVGRIKPENSVSVNGQPIDTDLSGEFTQNVTVAENGWTTFLVRSPLGAEAFYQLYLSPQGYILDAPTTLGR